MVMDLLRNPTFIVFGFGFLIVAVKIIADTVVRTQQLRTQSRERMRQIDLETDRRLLAEVDESLEIGGLKLRVQALEKEMTQTREWLQQVYRNLAGPDARLPGEPSRTVIAQAPPAVTVGKAKESPAEERELTA